VKTCGIEDLIRTETSIKNYKTIIGADFLFDGLRYYNDVKITSENDVVKTIDDLSRSLVRVKDHSLKYAISLLQTIKKIENKSTNIIIKHEVKYVADFAVIKQAIFIKIMNWLKLARRQIQRKWNVIKESAPKRKPLRRPDQGRLRKKRFIPTSEWTPERRIIILQKLHFNNWLYSFKRTLIKCVDRKWLIKKMNEGRSELIILLNHSTKLDYTLMKDKFTNLKQHLKNLITDDELISFLTTTTNDSLDEVKKRWFYKVNGFID